MLLGHVEGNDDVRYVNAGARLVVDGRPMSRIFYYNITIIRYAVFRCSEYCTYLPT